MQLDGKPGVVSQLLTHINKETYPFLHLSFLQLGKIIFEKGVMILASLHFQPVVIILVPRPPHIKYRH